MVLGLISLLFVLAYCGLDSTVYQSAFVAPIAAIADKARAARIRAQAKRAAEDERRKRLERAEANLFYFAKYYFPKFFEDATPKFHWELAQLARTLEKSQRDRGFEGCVIAAPRGHAKSTIVTFLVPLYWICFKKKRYIVIVSETGDLAESLVSDIRHQLEENERLRADFGDLCGINVRPRPQKWTTTDLIAAHQDENNRPLFMTRVKARSTGGSFRGIRWGDVRPDAVICDDLEKDEHVRTPEQRQKLRDWFFKVVLPAIDPHVGGFVVVGTILHFDSLLNNLLKQATDAEAIRKKALADGDPDPPELLYLTRMYRAIQDGKALWPERFSLKWLDKKRHAMGTLSFNQEYLNHPIDEEARIYRPEWIQWYTANELGYDRDKRRWSFRGEELDVYIGVDPAIDEKEQSDYFAACVIGYARKANCFVILYTFASRLDFPSQVKMIRKMADTWNPKYIGIEEVAYQRALPQQLLHEDGKLPIKRLDNGTAANRKYTRILAASVHFENGRVFMRRAVGEERGEPEENGPNRVFWSLWPLYEQMMQYPMSAHDDLLDSMEMALQLAKHKTRAFAEHNPNA
jgi:phage terminase large subunit-like protein